jgi:hypothetical protein
MIITPRSFFNITLKIFGLFFLREIINEIPRTVLMFSQYFSVSDFEGSISGIIVSLLIVGFYIILALQLLFKTNPIIEVLKLEKGFSEHEFTFEQRKENKISLSADEILLISLIILGGYILVDQIPEFCKLAYLFIDQRKSFYANTGPSVSNIFVVGAKIVLALLLLGERKKIIAFILSRAKEDSNDSD